MAVDMTNLVEIGDKISVLYETKNGENIVLVSNVLHAPNENKITITMPIYKAKVFSVSRGERLRIKYSKKDAGIYEFNALVVKKIKDGTILGIELLRISEMTKSQRREFYRLTVIKDVELIEDNPDQEVKYIDEANQIMEDPEEISYKGILKDISGGGMRIITNEQLELGLNVKSSFALDKKVIDVKGIIVRSIVFDKVVHQFDIGVEFQELSERSRSEIVSFVFQRQRNIIRKGMG